MKIRPLNDRVHVRRLEAPDITPGGIVLPDGAKERPQKGKVLAVGPGRLLADSAGNYIGEQRVPCVVQVGDVVLFSKYGGYDIANTQGEMMIAECEILAVLEE